MTGFPRRPELVDAPWLTTVLRHCGLLREAAVQAVVPEAVGHGLLGETLRLRLTLDRPEPGAPETVVGKFASRHAAPRELCRTSGLYLREVRFFQQVAPCITMQVPRALFADIDVKSHDYALITEDLAPARSGDQLVGCSVDDCALALREAAALHAANWGRSDLDRIPWLQGLAPRARGFGERLPDMVKRITDRFGDRLEADAVAELARFAPAYVPLVLDTDSARTLVHGDFRLDNVLFDVRGRRGSMATLDWQTVAPGSGLFDVAFFLGGALSVEQRRQHERALLGEYLAALRSMGVRDYGADDAWRDYRRFAARGLFTAISAPLGVAGTERSDRMFLKLLRQLTQQSLDLDSLSFWSG